MFEATNSEESIRFVIIKFFIRQFRYETYETVGLKQIKTIPMRQNFPLITWICIVHSTNVSG